LFIGGGGFYPLFICVQIEYTICTTTITFNQEYQMLDHNKLNAPIIFTWIQRYQAYEAENPLQLSCYKYTFIRDETDPAEQLHAHWIYRGRDGNYSAEPSRCTVTMVDGDDSHLTIYVKCPLRGTHDGSWIEIPLSECYEMKETIHPEHGYSRLSFIEGGEQC
jgi:hypothetical protein